MDEPRFKVGDRIRIKGEGKKTFVVGKVIKSPQPDYWFRGYAYQLEGSDRIVIEGEIERADNKKWDEESI